MANAIVNQKYNPYHNHDDRYYTEEESNTKLNGKSDIRHTHDDRYFTETEINIEVDEERLNLEAELRCLTSKLCSNNDELGDWKLSKIHEYSILGLKCPYTEEELNVYHTERQKIRDRINEVEERLSLI